jgi:hypothetical protein
MIFQFSGQVFEKYPNIKFHRIPASGNYTSFSTWTDTDERTDGRTDGREEMRKLVVAFRNFAKARKNASVNKTKFRKSSPFRTVSRKSAIFVCREIKGEGKTLLDSLRYKVTTSDFDSLAPPTAVDRDKFSVY